MELARVTQFCKSDLNPLEEPVLYGPGFQLVFVLPIMPLQALFQAVFDWALTVLQGCAICEMWIYFCAV